MFCFWRIGIFWWKRKKKNNSKLSLQKLPLSSASSCCFQEEPTATQQGWGQCPRASQILVPSLSPELPTTAVVPGWVLLFSSIPQSNRTSPQPAIPSTAVQTQTLAPHQAEQQQTLSSGSLRSSVSFNQPSVDTQQAGSPLGRDVPDISTTPAFLLIPQCCSLEVAQEPPGSCWWGAPSKPSPAPGGSTPGTWRALTSSPSCHLLLCADTSSKRQPALDSWTQLRRITACV